jgi:hypothetical protein
MSDGAPKLLVVAGRYVIGDVIGRGGAATVHLGKQVGPGRRGVVAIKRLHPHLAADPTFLAMMLDEARLLSRVRHENVVGTLDVVMEGGELYIVMDYVHGVTLGALLGRAHGRKERAPVAVACAIARDALLGLHAAHEATAVTGEPLGMVHRDVSPQNLLVAESGVLKVVDFGIAKAEGRVGHTMDGSIKGKLGYMPPEQLFGEALDRRADVYAAGVVLWETLVGERLFVGDDGGTALAKSLVSHVTPPSERAPGIGEALDRVVLRALAHDREQRFATARAMADALCEAQAPASAAEVAAWVRFARGGRARRAGRAALRVRSGEPGADPRSAAAAGQPRFIGYGQCATRTRAHVGHLARRGAVRGRGWGGGGRDGRDVFGDGDGGDGGCHLGGRRRGRWRRGGRSGRRERDGAGHGGAGGPAERDHVDRGRHGGAAFRREHDRGRRGDAAPPPRARERRLQRSRPRRRMDAILRSRSMRRVTSGTSASASGRRAAAAIAGALAALTWCGPALADAVEECASASEEGQELRDRGRLQAARARFVTCAAEQCPAIVQKDCAGWLASVEEELPSVIVRARDTQGRDLAEVRVTVDGQVLAERLDGRALVVDPGSHTFRFATAGAPEATQTLLLREGEKGRVIDVVLGVMGREGGPKGGADGGGGRGRTFSVPAAAWVLGGVSVAAFGALAGFGVSATTAVDDMRKSCAPRCSEERVDAARRDMILANVALGAGVLALGAAAVVVAVHDVGPRAGATGPRVHVAAGPAGVALSAAW